MNIFENWSRIALVFAVLISSANVVFAKDCNFDSKMAADRAHSMGASPTDRQIAADSARIACQAENSSRALSGSMDNSIKYIAYIVLAFLAYKLVLMTFRVATEPGKPDTSEMDAEVARLKNEKEANTSNVLAGLTEGDVKNMEMLDIMVKNNVLYREQVRSALMDRGWDCKDCNGKYLKQMHERTTEKFRK